MIFTFWSWSKNFLCMRCQWHRMHNACSVNDTACTMHTAYNQLIGCRAECHIEESKFESGLPQAWPDCMYSWQPERGAWQSAVHLRAVCQEVITFVAIRGIWPWNLANDRIPAPAILHRQVSCLLRHKFLKRDSPGARYIRGGLFRPKLYTNSLKWHTISWYYPFNYNDHKNIYKL
jgi:hypothetical protein